ncbi:BT4734/BF3469 family protein [Chryseobacterium sp. R2A-55]|uniref:BT4734/BF3469 family protein n=1 Tax=Chryseobacterium sp. R2A-55 TaxID=2744445 RepID=UPI001F3D71B6|nr:BT4734/BF3469 family protein [Chryseobacterium sp. R2A-55]
MLKIYDNVFSKNSTSEFKNPEEVINFIRGDRPDLAKIKQLRTLEKGTEDSNRIKTSLPAILWNFDSSGCRRKECLTESTGLIYFDVDRKNGTEVNYEFNKDYFYAYWKSVTGTGYGSLVRVSGVTTENFDEAYKIIADTLHIPYDESADRKTQLNILSYDPDIFFNPNSEVIDFSYLQNEINPEAEIEKNTQPIEENVFFMNSERVTTFSKLRYDNFDEKSENINLQFDENGLCDLGENRIHYTQVYVPKVINQGNRHATLQRIAIQLITLNPHVNLNQLSSLIWTINKEKCYPSKLLSETDNLCKSCLNGRDNYKLFPNKTRRFFFEDPSLPRETKISMITTYRNRQTGLINQNNVLIKMQELVGKGEKFKLKVLLKLTGIKTTKTLVKHLKAIKSHFQPTEWNLLLTNAKI